MFSCEYCEAFNTTYLENYLRTVRAQNGQTYIATFLTHLNILKHLLETVQVVLVKFKLMKSWNIKLFLIIDFTEQ